MVNTKYEFCYKSDEVDKCSIKCTPSSEKGKCSIKCSPSMEMNKCASKCTPLMDMNKCDSKNTSSMDTNKCPSKGTPSMEMNKCASTPSSTMNKCPSKCSPPMETNKCASSSSAMMNKCPSKCTPSMEMNKFAPTSSTMMNKCPSKCNSSMEINKCSSMSSDMSSDVNYIKNPYINEKEDVLFHLTLSNKTHDLKAMFHDVKFVCMGGTVHRMKGFAQCLLKELGLPAPQGGEVQDLTGHGHRYSMFKVGCVICVNHGMGYPSIMILLHELIKLMQYARVKDPIFIRMGTSGGVDVKAGTVVIATKALNDFMEPCFEVTILGRRYKWPSILDEKLAQEFKMIAENKHFPVLLGATISNEHFYESTAMKAGAICEHSDKERKEYLNKLKSNKILSMDMEAIALAAITHRVGIKSVVINVVVNDAFTEKEDAPTPDMIKDWQTRPQQVVVEYIKAHCLSNSQKPKCAM